MNFLYHDIVIDWFAETLGSIQYKSLLESLTQGQLDIFLKILKNFLMDSASYFDVSGKQPEKFYHGLVMGWLISLAETHRLRSNRESGYGRYDVLLIPHDKTKLGIVLEFKVADKDDDIEAMANDALKKINERHYAAELAQQDIKKILNIGLAFRGKHWLWPLTNIVHNPLNSKLPVSPGLPD